MKYKYEKLSTLAVSIRRTITCTYPCIMCGGGYVPGWGIKDAVGPTRIPSMVESDIPKMSVTDAYSSTHTVVYSLRGSLASSEANDAHQVTN